MTTVLEIESAVENLSQAEFEQFSNWFQKLEESRWDKDIAKDAKSGILNSLAEEALNEYNSGEAQEI